MKQDSVTGNDTGSGGTASGTNSSSGQAGNGGGMFNSSSDPHLIGVTFGDNRLSVGHGAGMFNEESSPTLINVAFIGNQAAGGGGGGGGMYNSGGSPTLINVAFSGNYANSRGGGIYNLDSSPTLTNATVSGNRSLWSDGDGGGMFNAGTGIPVVRNSIFWGNPGGDQIGWFAVAPDVQYSDVQSMSFGTGCIDEDPLFVLDPDPGDGSWSSWWDNDYGDLRLRAGSPAIDAGDNAAVPGDALDLDGDGDTGERLPCDHDELWRIVGESVDMGAYERPVTASLPLVLRGFP
jgi:hypothetical protein